MATKASANQDTKTISIDSGDFLMNQYTNNSSFSVDLQETLNLNENTDIFLSSVYITAFKMNEKHALHWSTAGENPSTPDGSGNDDETVNIFNFYIPQFENRNIAGKTGSKDAPSHRKFTLPNENPVVSFESGTLSDYDYKPFILGHLGQTAVYVSTVTAKSFNRIDVSITDQDGKSIFKGRTNPPLLSRRIYMSFILKPSTR